MINENGDVRNRMIDIIADSPNKETNRRKATDRFRVLLID